MTIVIVNSGVANLTSVQAALERLGINAKVSDVPSDIAAAERVILPGVGAAATAMDNLKTKGLADTIRALTCPVLGICLGMQLLFDQSEEGAPCLGIISGTVHLLPSGEDLLLPHMGWNQIEKTQSSHPLLRSIDTGAFVYYVHSFAAPIGPYTVAQTVYGQPFTAIAAHNNFMGCQFHPERSGETGSRILRNFIEME